MIGQIFVEMRNVQLLGPSCVSRIIECILFVQNGARR